MAEENIEIKAVIDLGTNTFNLLIGKVGPSHFEILHSSKLPVLLGMGGINKGMITIPALERAKEALSSFKAICKKYGANSILGIGTSALRSASNSDELLRYAKEELDIPIEIISGGKEAAYIYKGVNLSYQFQDQGLIMDIGGGSTEFIHVDNHGINELASLDIGVSRIYQMLDKPANYSLEHITMVQDFLNKTESGKLAKMEGTVLIGSSGSFETFYELIFKKKFQKGENALSIPLMELNKAIDYCINAPLEERMNNEWIVPFRKQMLPIAAIQLKWVLDKFSIENVLVSPYSLKEGVLIS